MIDTILWDVDGTLLDFKAAERAALKALFPAFGLGVCTDAMIARYSVINVGYWERLERGELTKTQALTGRFECFFQEYGFDPQIVAAFNDAYQGKLADTIVFLDDSLRLVKELKGTVRQYAVSNGTIAAQTKKLKRSSLDQYLDGVFLSEQLGVEKPHPVFFEKLFSSIGPEARATALIVGDSLTSDIRGGMNAGIRTCWYNPQRKPVPDAYRVGFVISDLREIKDILSRER